MTDTYALKNASIRFKTVSTLGLLASLTLMALSWFLTVTVIGWNHTGRGRMMSIGHDLYNLAWDSFGVYVGILLLQAIGYAGLYFIARALFRRAALRRRMKALILFASKALVVLHFLVWFGIPFFAASQILAGPVGLVSTLGLILLTLPAVGQMWLYTRWRNASRKRVVIVGGGFAGLYTAMGLDQALGYHRDLEIILIDQKNFFLFPPLLPSAAVGTIETRQVTYPYRRIFETTNIRYKKATVVSIEPVNQRVRMHVHWEEEEQSELRNPSAPESLADAGVAQWRANSEIALSYDYLVLAPGSTTQTFNTLGADRHALFVRELGDAIKIRSRIIDCFERAAVLQDEAARRELLSFAVVGGGPTGVEIATEIQDLIHEVLLKRYPEIDPALPRVTIVQSGPQVLPGWPEKVVRLTTRQLERLGVRLVLNNRVTEIRRNAVVLKDGAPVEARTTLWCAGVKPSPLLRATGLELDKGGRVPVDAFLRPAGFENVFVLGDAATCLDHKSGKALPPLGQVAFQQGPLLAANLVRLLRGKALKPFRYFNFGALVSVGEHFAAVDLLGVKLSGFIGWITWRMLYLSKIVGMSNRIRILLDWTLDLFIERSISQLQDTPHPSPESSTAPELISR